MTKRSLVAFSVLVSACSTTTPTKTSDSQLQCMAEAINGEARGESSAGQIFVGRVILTRLARGYGNTLCDIVYAPRQFAPKSNFNKSILTSALRAAELGPNNVTHFHSYPKKKTPLAQFSLSNQCYFKIKVGAHWGFDCQDRRLASE